MSQEELFPKYYLERIIKNNKQTHIITKNKPISGDMYEVMNSFTSEPVCISNHELEVPFIVGLAISQKETAKGCNISISPFLICCDECNGTGDRSKRELEVCEECNGTGIIDKTKTIFSMTIYKNKECKNCNGKGSLIKMPCDSCKGKGSVNKPFSFNIPAGVLNGEKISLFQESGINLELIIYVQ